MALTDIVSAEKEDGAIDMLISMVVEELAEKLHTEVEDILPEFLQCPFIHFALQQQPLAFDDFFIIVRQFHVFFQRSEPHFRRLFLQQPVKNRLIHLFLLRITCFF